jgi:hypothetical protein
VLPELSAGSVANDIAAIESFEEIGMHWKRRSWILIGVLLAACTASAVAQVTTTEVMDTVYHADGTTATGTVLISWQAFTTSSELGR